MADAWLDVGDTFKLVVNTYSMFYKFSEFLIKAVNWKA